MPILVRGGLVIAEGGRIEGGAVRIEGNRIAWIGKDGQAAARADAPGTTVIDASRAIVLPGLINAHTHSNEAFEQGAYDNMPLEVWMMHNMPPFGMKRLSERDHYLRTMLCAVESIRSGVTTIQDDILTFFEPEAVDGAVNAYRDIGLHAVVTVTMLDCGFLDRRPFLRELVPPDLAAELDALPVPARAEQIALFMDHFRRWHAPENGISIIPAPTSPQRCSNELLQEAADIAARYDLAMHIHTDETKTQAVAARHFWGKSLVERLSELGVLSPRLSLNHGIWLTPKDIGLVGEAGCSVTHNPLSNMKLGSGVCPVRALLDAGANVALGTDGLSSSDTADLMEALRAAALVHKLGGFEPERWISAHEAFHMGTHGGAASTNMAHDVGSLAVGKKADLILLDRDAWGFIPLHDPIRQMAYSVTSETVTTSIIDGRIVMRDRKLTLVDEGALKAQVQEAAERFRRDHWPALQAGAARVAPYIRQMHDKATAMEIDFGHEPRVRPV
ncbi:MAG: amidohydrolase family protein [Alphaproteobacteria bacterium]